MKILPLKHSRSGFTLVELLIGMTIFSVGITSIFLLLHSTLKTASVSRNEIVVANLIREQLELTKFLRDSNVKNFSSWNNGIWAGNFLVYNNFEKKDGISYKDTDGSVDFWGSSVVFDEIFDPNFGAETLEAKFNRTQLCYNTKKFFVPCSSDISLTEKTPFAAYTTITPMKMIDDSGNETIIEKDGEVQGYTIDSRVIVKNGTSYYEYDWKTHITDWK